MGQWKEQLLREQDEAEARMAQADWPKCVRCDEPVEAESVWKGQGSTGKWEWQTDEVCCSYCRHVAARG
jgi:hypothetical protein